MLLMAGTTSVLATDDATPHADISTFRRRAAVRPGPSICTPAVVGRHPRPLPASPARPPACCCLTQACVWPQRARDAGLTRAALVCR